MANDLKLTFSTTKKGYDPIEVDKAINNMFHDIKIFEEQAKNYVEKIKQQEETIKKVEQAREKECANLAKLVTAAASIAEQAEADAVEKAKELTRDAEQMVADAQQRAKEILEDADIRVGQLEQESAMRMEQREKESTERAEKYEKDASERAEIRSNEVAAKADETEKKARELAEKIISDAQEAADEIKVQAENYLAMVKKDYSDANVIIAKLQGEIKSAQDKNSQISQYLDQLNRSVTQVATETGAPNPSSEQAEKTEQPKKSEPTTYTIKPIPSVIEQRADDTTKSV